MSYFRFIAKVPFKFKTVDFKGWWEGSNPHMTAEELDILQSKYPVKIIKRWVNNVPLLFSVVQNISIVKSCIRYQPTIVTHPTKQLGYVRIPKAGSSSIISSLFSAEISNGESLNTVEWVAYYHYLSKGYNQSQSLKYFSVVRNPFARLVSAYLNSYLDDSTHHYVYGCYLFGIFKRNYTFSEFVDCLSVIPRSLLLDNIKPQKFILDQAKIESIQIFKLEEDQIKLMDFLKIDGNSLKQLNASNSHDYRVFYNRESFEKASEVYLVDILEFNYIKECEELENFVKHSE